MKKSRSSIPRFDAKEEVAAAVLVVAPRALAELVVVLLVRVAIAVGKTNDGSEFPAKLCKHNAGTSGQIIRNSIT